MKNESADEEASREEPDGYPLQWVEGMRPDDVNRTDETSEGG
jgi:hypothetical protein